MFNQIDPNLYSDLLKAFIPIVSVVIGGIIGGGVSYFISKSNFQREKESRESGEFRALIREIAVNFSEFEDASNKLMAYHIDVANRAKGNPFSFDEVHAEYANALAKYRQTKAAIKIFKLEEADEILAKCIKSSNDVFVGYQRLKAAEMRYELSEFRINTNKFYDVLSSYSNK